MDLVLMGVRSSMVELVMGGRLLRFFRLLLGR